MIAEETAAVQQEFTADRIFCFPAGIPGFENYTRFHVFHKQEKEICAYWLESLDEPKLTFTLVDPTSFDLHYEFTLSDDDQKLLQAQTPDSCAVLLMLSKKVNENTEKSRLQANIVGPIVINLDNQIGMQKVITRGTGKVTMNVN